MKTMTSFTKKEGIEPSSLENSIVIVIAVLNGDHGRFAICGMDGVKESITFSIKEAWEEKREPTPGTRVRVWGVFRKRAGLRANFASYA